MNTVFYIARRYAFSKSKTKAINIITLISSIGIMVSSMAMFVVLSVFSGLENYSLSFVNSMDADLSAMPASGKFFTVPGNDLKKVNSIEGVQACAKVVEERVVFTFNTKQLVATLKGVDKNYLDIADITPHLIAGQWLEPHTQQVVLGNSFANALSVGMFSNTHVLEVLAMKPGKGMVSTPEEAYTKFPLYPSGIYAFNNVEADARYVYADITLGQQLLGWNPEQISRLELKLKQGASEKEVTKALQEIFKNKLVVKDRVALNSSLYKMLQTERLAIYLIFSLVIMVTLFCLAGALIMIILEKKEHFKTLSDMGFTLLQLRRIVLYQGLILSIGGALIGMLSGFVFAYLQARFQFITISEGLPYPVALKWENFVIVWITLIILGFLASFLASSRLRIKSY